MSSYLRSQREITFLSVFLASTFTAWGQLPELDGGSNLMLRSRDMAFAMNLSQYAAGGVVLGLLAAEKSQNSAVQSFGKTMAADLSQANESLRTIVTPMHVTLPQEIPADELSARYKLQNLTSGRVDRAYLKATLKETIGRIKKVKTEIKKGHNSAIQRFAIETLPVLEDHLEKARSLYRATEKKT